MGNADHNQLQYEELKKLNDMKSELIDAVSHELRTPLTVIQEGTALISQKVLGDITPQQEDMLNDILNCTDRLTNIIDKLLDASKLESGQISVKKTDLDSVKLIQDFVKRFEVRANAKKISLKIQLPEKLFKMYADPRRINQVLANLVGNSIKFTAEMGEIMVSARNVDDMVEIVVKDNGSGISRGDMPKVFGKFQQFSREYGGGEKGTGLGLAISKKIMDLHQGKIWAESEIDKGTAVFVRVPRFVSYEAACLSTLTEHLESMKRAGGESRLSLVYLEGAESMDQDKMLVLVKKSLSRAIDTAVKSKKGRIIALLPYTDGQGASVVRIKLQKKFSDQKLRYGTATYPDNGSSAEELMEAVLKNASDNSSPSKES
jgi:anti-sigma regulatory factor (Ser/Thr protein kinase)